MRKIDLLYGIICCFFTTLLGSFIFIEVFTNYHFMNGIAFFKANGLLGKIITLGAILNLALFYFLLKINREMMAKGIILGMILLTLLTLFI